MRSGAVLAVVLASGCAPLAYEPPASPPAIWLQSAPERPYREIAPLQVQGRPGEHVTLVRRELQRQAAAMGADAVVETGVERRVDRTPAPIDAPPGLFANAYPGALHALEPGGAPLAAPVDTRGVYYTVHGIAVDYPER